MVSCLPLASGEGQMTPGTLSLVIENSEQERCHRGGGGSFLSPGPVLADPGLAILFPANLQTPASQTHVGAALLGLPYIHTPKSDPPGVTDQAGHGLRSQLVAWQHSHHVIA